MRSSCILVIAGFADQFSFVCPHRLPCLTMLAVREFLITRVAGVIYEERSREKAWFYARARIKHKKQPAINPIDPKNGIGSGAVRSTGCILRS